MPPEDVSADLRECTEGPSLLGQSTGLGGTP